jgi:hypothetical protein
MLPNAGMLALAIADPNAPAAAPAPKTGAGCCEGAPKGKVLLAIGAPKLGAPTVDAAPKLGALALADVPKFDVLAPLNTAAVPAPKAWLANPIWLAGTLANAFTKDGAVLGADEPKVKPAADAAGAAPNAAAGKLKDVAGAEEGSAAPKGFALAADAADGEMDIMLSMLRALPCRVANTVSSLQHTSQYIKKPSLASASLMQQNVISVQQRGFKYTSSIRKQVLVMPANILSISTGSKVSLTEVR